MSNVAAREPKAEVKEEPFTVVRKKDLKRQDWGVGTDQFERSLWHILTPAMGSKHAWFAYQETPRGRMGQWHHHTYDEFYYVLKGVATVTGANGQSVKVEAGDTIFIPAYSRHQTVNEGTETLAFLFAYVPPPNSIDEKVWLDSTSPGAEK